MINLIDKKNKLNENKNSLVITYPRTVHIMFGNYPYPEKIHNFILEIKNNLSEKIKYLHHIHGILYLTKGCDLNIPELNIRITPEPGDYYILPPYIQHGFEKHSGESNRYCLVFNLHNNPLSHFDYNKKIEKMK